jgi:hypothetical protein
VIESNQAGRAAAPGHLWLVGILALLWNAMGAWDHWLTVTDPAVAMADQPPEMLEYVEAMPTWAVSAWGIAVYSAVLGSLLLLLRKRLAGPLFILSFVAMLATNVYTYVLSDGMQLHGSTGQLAFAAAIFVVALLLVVYTRAMCKRGVLS